MPIFIALILIAETIKTTYFHSSKLITYIIINYQVKHHIDPETEKCVCCQND